MEKVQTAGYCVTRAAEHGSPMSFAQMGMLQALNRRRQRVFNSDRKDPHWGRRERDMGWRLIFPLFVVIVVTPRPVVPVVTFRPIIPIVVTPLPLVPVGTPLPVVAILTTSGRVKNRAASGV